MSRYTLQYTVHHPLLITQLSFVPFGRTNRYNSTYAVRTRCAMHDDDVVVVLVTVSLAFPTPLDCESCMGFLEFPPRSWSLGDPTNKIRHPKSNQSSPPQNTANVTNKPVEANMTIGNTTPASTAGEPDFFSAPIYEYGMQPSTTPGHSAAATSSWLVPYDDSSAANMPVVEPFSSATALTADQSYRHENQKQQLITIPSSSVLIDTSAPTQITQNIGQSNRPVQGVPVDPYPFEPASSIISSNNNNNNNTNSKYIRQYGLLVNRKKAHLPEPLLRFQQTRKRRTKVAAWTGGAVGLVVGGPLGAAVGAGAAYASAKTVGKTRERRIQNRCAVTRHDPTPERALLVEDVVMV